MVPRIVNIWPSKCPNCGASLVRKNALLKYSVDSVQYLGVDDNGRAVASSVGCCPPTMTLCANCHSQVRYKMGHVDEDGKVHIDEDDDPKNSENTLKSGSN